MLQTEAFSQKVGALLARLLNFVGRPIRDARELRQQIGIRDDGRVVVVKVGLRGVGIEIREGLRLRRSLFFVGVLPATAG